ncbi:hypothetical protein OS493_022146 [Desmophyllum pertusum]|uniref:Uncharacterized protein n=1 Tax=Desmophyllum pertusum TaxID=174260 RepID=A0A9W9YQG1_9CNID|nr:hypothetical protein OS493_022146 [Desmophyllum pertusum]
MSAGLTGRLPQPAVSQQPMSVVGCILQPLGADRHPMSVGLPGHLPQPSAVTDRQPMPGGGRIPQPLGVANRQPMSAGGRISQSLGVTDRQPISADGHLPQPLGVSDQQNMSAGGHIPQPLGIADRQPMVGRIEQPSGVADRQPVSFSLTGRMPQPMVHIHRYLVFVDLSSLPQLTKAFIPDLLVKDIKRLHRTTDGNPSEPPQVTRHVNNVTQQIGQNSGLRPEDRARLSRLESRKTDECQASTEMNITSKGGWMTGIDPVGITTRTSLGIPDPLIQVTRATLGIPGLVIQVTRATLEIPVLVIQVIRATLGIPVLVIQVTSGTLGIPDLETGGISTGPDGSGTMTNNGETDTNIRR